MRSNSQIIELYGLPGCGKTTLRDMLVAERNGGSAFFLMTELSSQFRKLSLLKKLRYIPWTDWINLVRLIGGMPILPLKDWFLYKVLFVFSLVYNFASYVDGPKTIVVDHGFVQGIVSLMNGHLTFLTKKQLNLIQRLLSSFQHCKFVFCNVCVETSMSRIGSRGRKCGRLDVINETSVLRKKLEEEYFVFEQLTSALNNDSRIVNFKIDCNQDILCCLHEFKNFLLQ